MTSSPLGAAPSPGPVGVCIMPTPPQMLAGAGSKTLSYSRRSVVLLLSVSDTSVRRQTGTCAHTHSLP